MLEIVHDEKSPILQVPGSVTYGCVMVGMAMLALLALQSAWRAWRQLARPGAGRRVAGPGRRTGRPAEEPTMSALILVVFLVRRRRRRYRSPTRC